MTFMVVPMSPGVGVELLSMVSGLAFSVGRRRWCRLLMASVVVSMSPGPRHASSTLLLGSCTNEHGPSAQQQDLVVQRRTSMAASVLKIGRA